MHRLLICIVAVFLLPASASARVFRIWSYEALLKEADVVAIVKVTKVEDTKARLEGNGDPDWYQGRLAHATVGLMLKGDARKTLSFQFFFDDYPNRQKGMSKAEKIYRLDGPSFADLSKTGKVHYLVFLKKTADGALAPATGHGNARASIYEVAPQSVNAIDVAPVK